jgi:hypothetical protein
MSLGVFKVGMSLTTLVVFNTSTYLFFPIVMKTPLPLSWRTFFLWFSYLFVVGVEDYCCACSHTHTHTHTHTRYHSSERGIGPSQRPLPI